MRTFSGDSVRAAEASSALDVVMRYHQETKHHFFRYARSLGYMDWANQPDPFRRYAGSPLRALPRLTPDDAPVSPLYQDLYRGQACVSAPVTLRSLSRFFEYALAISAWKQAGELRWALRTNPSSGNLHPTEGYLLIDEVAELSPLPGVYHYTAKEHALELRAELPQATIDSLVRELPPSAFLVAFASVHWRETWKYGERAFRYCQHDAGHAIGSARVAAQALGWRMLLLDGVSGMGAARARRVSVAAAFSCRPGFAAKHSQPTALTVASSRCEGARRLRVADGRASDVPGNRLRVGNAGAVVQSRPINWSIRPWTAIDVLASNRSLQHPFSDSIGARSGFAVTSGAPLPGARLGPAAERPGKYRRVRIAQRRSDFRQWQFRILQKLLRKLETRLTDELLQAGPRGGQPLAQCPFVHAEQERHVPGRRRAAKHHLVKRASHFVGEAHRAVGASLPDGLHDQLTEVGVCGGDGVVKPRRCEHDAGHFGIESNMRTKKAPVRTWILRSSMRKLDPQRLPVGSAHLLQRPVPDCNGYVVKVRGAGCPMSVYGVAKQHMRRLQTDQYRDSPAIVQVEMQEKCPQRLANGGRVAHQVSDGAEAVQLEALADEQAEMAAARQRRAFGEQAAQGLEGDPVLGILERGERDSGPYTRETRCEPQPSQDVWNRSDRTDPDFGGGRSGWVAARRRLRLGAMSRVAATPGEGPVSDGLCRSSHPATSKLPTRSGNAANYRGRLS